MLKLTDFTTFLKHDDSELVATSFLLKLLQPNSSAEAGRATTDDADIHFILCPFNALWVEFGFGREGPYSQSSKRTKESS